MKDVFIHLNKVPPETRREWGIPFKDYSFAVEVCDALLAKMARNTERVKAANAAGKTKKSTVRHVREKGAI